MAPPLFLRSPRSSPRRGALASGDVPISSADNYAPAVFPQPVRRPTRMRPGLTSEHDREVEAAALTRRGLTRAEASRRHATSGAAEPRRSSRSYASIVRANVFTVFNLILLVAGTATLVFGEWQDALFLGVLVSNSGVGTYEEVRAKRALDRLSALVAPTARVVRDGPVRP